MITAFFNLILAALNVTIFYTLGEHWWNFAAALFCVGCAGFCAGLKHKY